MRILITLTSFLFSHPNALIRRMAIPNRPLSEVWSFTLVRRSSPKVLVALARNQSYRILISGPTVPTRRTVLASRRYGRCPKRISSPASSSTPWVTLCNLLFWIRTSGGHFCTIRNPIWSSLGSLLVWTMQTRTSIRTRNFKGGRPILIYESTLRVVHAFRTEHGFFVREACIPCRS